jgi:hypothetical protein
MLQGVVQRHQVVIEAEQGMGNGEEGKGLDTF